MKKKTNAELQAEIEDLKKQIPESTNSISHCNLTAVQWDGKALESVQTVAKGLLNLTELFKSQNINIEAMIKINPTSIETAK